MRIRPRYSLLTLLVLTALVAGGVKAWFGPWRVLERPEAHLEEEYAFTRDWRGTRTIDGPFIRRIYKLEPRTLQSVNIDYYRAGLKQVWSYVLFVDLPAAGSPEGTITFARELQLSPDEQNIWRNAILQEKSELATQGFTPQGIWWQSWLAENLKNL